MMKFYRLLEKDIKSFMRRRTSMILLFIAPLIVMLVLGMIFSAEVGGEMLKGVRLIVCDLDQGDLSSELVAKLEESSTFEVYTTQNCTEAEQSVNMGLNRAMLKFDPGFSENIKNGISQNLTIYVDNSNSDIEGAVSTFMGASVHTMSVEIGKEFISLVWDKLGEMSNTMDELVVSLNSTKEDLSEMTIDLNQTRNKFQAIPLGEIQSDVNYVYGRIEKARNITQSLNGEVDVIESNITLAINGTYSAINITNTTIYYLNQTEKKLDDLVLGLDILSVSLNLLKSAANCGTPESLCSQAICLSVDGVIDQTEQVRDDANATKEYVRLLGLSLQELSDQLVLLSGYLQDLKEQAGRTSHTVDSTTPEIELALQKIEFIQSSLMDFDQLRNDTSEVMGQALIKTLEMEDKVGELELNIKTAQSSLRSFVQRQPQSVIQPVVLQHERAFSKRRYVDFLVPGIIGLVLMLSTLLLSSLNLIHERNSGVFDRMQLSTTYNFNLIIPRIISHLIFSAIQLLVLMIIALLFFGVQTEGSLIDTFLIGLLLSYPFIGIGLLLGFLTKSENTAILATIALSIPLMFLCGALFPFELMPPFMRIVGWLMPLTHGVEALRGVMIYGVNWRTIFQNLLIIFLEGTIPVLAAIWVSKKHSL